MNITCICFGILFLVAGSMFFIGKGHIHISAWKEMTDVEKEKVDIVPLCRNIGGVISLCGFIFLISGLWIAFKNHVFVWSMIIWLIVAGTDVYFIGKSKRYIKNNS
ncbi:MAG: DUF3784 domain-containing protein [Anaerostipes sp.]|nr:DUF3784 domain-containing protein [Anaerostipes sp.]